MYRNYPLRHTVLRVFSATLIAFCFATVAFAQFEITNYNGSPAVADEIVIRARGAQPALLARLRNVIPTADVESLNSQLDLHLIRSPGRSLTALLQAFSNHPDVLYAEPNYVVSTVTTPNDTFYSSLWGLPRIGAPAAWDLTTGGTSAVVGVVDTGVDYNHPDLAANIWSAPAAFSVTVGGSLINCPAGSHGFNAITLSCDPQDDNNHGTHVSGTIGATGNNNTGVVGVNWTARIMGLKFLNATGSGSISGAIRAIEFARKVKQAFAGTSTPVNVRVLSNSWSGSGFSQSLLDQINLANAEDFLFVAAAGNSSSNNDITPVYPANYSAPNVIAVAATTSADVLAGFSNYGKTKVHLGAPGQVINSTVRSGGYAYYSGTSMATPHVAGAALLTLSLCPSLTTAAVRNAILANVDPLPSLQAYTITGGRLNVNNAVRSCASPAPMFVNASFETPALGSSFQYGPSGPGVGWTFSGPSGIQGNGSAWGAAPAPDGTQTAFVQGTGSISQQFNLNSGGYTLSFRVARRPYSDPAGSVQPIRVSVDGAQVGGPVSPAGTSFSLVTVPFSIAATGVHTLAFSGTDSSGDKSTFIDAVTLTTSGSGTPSFTSPASTSFVEGQAFSFTVQATGSPTPALSRSGVLPSGITFTDNGNGTATLGGTASPGTTGTYPLTFTATNAAGSVNQSFTLTVVAASVSNASFEMPPLGAGFQYGPSGAGVAWTFSGSAGIQGNGSAWGAPAAPNGTQTAFIQGTGTIRQSITLSAGNYTLSFQAARRSYSVPAASVQPIRITIDGAQIGGIVSPASMSFGTISVPFSVVSSGLHVLELAGTDGTGDKSTFLDAITVTPE